MVVVTALIIVILIAIVMVVIVSAIVIAVVILVFVVSTSNGSIVPLEITSRCNFAVQLLYSFRSFFSSFSSFTRKKKRSNF